MNKKLFFNVVFMTIGTVVLIAVSSVVFTNFAKDSRLLHPATQASATETPKPSADPEQKSDNNEATYKYKRAVDPVTPKVDYGEMIPKSETSEVKSSKNIKVAVINYSGIKNLAEEIRTVLESNGYTVSTSNATSNKPVSTAIYEWNDKKAGSEIQKLLKAGKVVKTPDPTSKFDITVYIGDDFKP